MNEPSAIAAQYATGLSRQRIEQALIAAGKDPNHLEPADLGALEDFHTSGRLATSELAELAGIGAHDRVLDAGCGIGGTARFLADTYGCRVTAVDLTEEYCATARWLDRIAGLDDRISVQRGDVTDLPFADASFDVVVSQHAQMNVADKGRLYREARRVLVSGGRLALWDIVAGATGEVDYPLPWADERERSHLVPGHRLGSVITDAGFTVVEWNDLTEPTATFMSTFLRSPLGVLGLHNFVDDFEEKAANLVRGLSLGSLRAVRGVARAEPGVLRLTGGFSDAPR
jgi:sarcosine/dimethylglycine N-methyltransferase